ncbi:hypothetical protein EYM_05145 [Ignicoccus islandicus DSM 13165]|uniref:Uncharacterized protein n=1 Tax=Ignicoccus islandicus DSM 13165 TaxID=940295 RepID=A0A0U3EB64_9CREN|nr:hypothetical protein [Ignicoccus islandicus]ALU12558.1 hypothetical protein EYM_05145 [Ignicoccus islandicus DSM 13165]
MSRRERLLPNERASKKTVTISARISDNSVLLILNLLRKLVLKKGFLDSSDLKELESGLPKRVGLRSALGECIDYAISEAVAELAKERGVSCDFDLNELVSKYKNECFRPRSWAPRFWLIYNVCEYYKRLERESAFSFKSKPESLRVDSEIGEVIRCLEGKGINVRKEAIEKAIKYLATKLCEDALDALRKLLANSAKA